LAILIVLGIWTLGGAAITYDWAGDYVRRAGNDGGESGARTVTLYKTPSCGCCNGYVAHLRRAGYRVETVDLEDLDPIKRMVGIEPELESCHTAAIDRYIVEGHVPAADIEHLLAERPDIPGIALPGMPEGAPGMSGPKPDHLTLYTIEKPPRPFLAQ
jgi:hypothetical protein